MTSQANTNHNRNGRSKPSSARDDGQQSNDVSFVNYNHPSEFLSNSARRAVRSHVTRRQHQIVRDARAVRPQPVQLARLAPRLEPAPLAPSPSSTSSSTPTHSPRSALPVEPNALPSGHQSPATPDALGPLTSRPQLRSRKISSKTATNAVKTTTRTVPVVHQPGRRDAHGALSRTAPTASQRPASIIASTRYPKELVHVARSAERQVKILNNQGRYVNHDFITISPPPSSDRTLLFGAMHSFMFENFGKPMWSRMGISTTDGELWEGTLARLSEAEPALLYARMLFAAGHLSKMGILGPGISAWLYERAVALVYQALTIESRRTSEALIIAIGRLALYEGLFGEKRYAHEIHRPAQYRLIAARGGMSNLKLPLISKYFLTWGDEMLAKQNNSHSLMGKEVHGAPVALSSDEAIKTLQAYYPFQYANLLRPAPSEAVEVEGTDSSAS